MTITLKDIEFAERAMDDVNTSLAAMGREIYRMREGQELSHNYGFENYSLQTFEGSHYAGQDGPDWGVGTPIVSLNYYWPRAGNTEYVTFPRSYLGVEWRALEQARIDQEIKADDEARAREAEEADLQKEISERQAYEQLHAKYGAGAVEVHDP
jgi:hypothetical protein